MLTEQIFWHSLRLRELTLVQEPYKTYFYFLMYFSVAPHLAIADRSTEGGFHGSGG